MKIRTVSLCTLVLGFFFILVGMRTTCAKGPSGYHLAKKVTLGGEGGWDYLYCDSKARRIYLSRGSHVMVVDADSGALVGDIPNTKGVHGFATRAALVKRSTM